MSLDLSIVENFISQHHSGIKDGILTRHDRYRILSELREHLDRSLVIHESFEDNLGTIIQAARGAESYHGLKELRRRAVSEIQNYFLEEKTVVDVHDLLGSLRDAVTARVLTLVEKEMEEEGYGAVPVDYCWAAVGSDGRDEHTFVTEQKNLLVFSEAESSFATDNLRSACIQYHRKLEARTKNDVGPKEFLDYYFWLFSEKVAKRLDFIGFSRSAGGIMPVNEKWRGSLSNWEMRSEEALNPEKSIDPLDLVRLVDARPIKGSVDLLSGVTGKVVDLLRNNETVMKDVTESVVEMPTALGLLGRFRLETTGENGGKFNVRLLGWDPLIMNVRVLSLRQGINETNTVKRIKALREMNVIAREVEEELTEAYLVFMRLRITAQIECDGREDLSYVDPQTLDAEDAFSLRKAMGLVEGLQKYVNELRPLRQAV
ncbi:MAG TPA: hypothetical protein DCR97_05650 [Deltaproteobacteria bacterium]|nr:hypothetical protein [Deltaproteobacteria bacterium]